VNHSITQIYTSASLRTTAYRRTSSLHHADDAPSAPALSGYQARVEPPCSTAPAPSPMAVTVRATSCRSKGNISAPRLYSRSGKGLFATRGVACFMWAFSLISPAYLRVRPMVCTCRGIGEIELTVPIGVELNGSRCVRGQGLPVPRDDAHHPVVRPGLPAAASRRKTL